MTYAGVDTSSVPEEHLGWRTVSQRPVVWLTQACSTGSPFKEEFVVQPQETGTAPSCKYLLGLELCSCFLFFFKHIY